MLDPLQEITAFASRHGLEAEGHRELSELVARMVGASLLIDVETGERIPHFIERERISRDPARTVLVIHPMAPMRAGATVVAALRGLVDANGALVEAPAGFAALRDGATSEDPDIERQRDRYEAVVFPALEAAGWSRTEAQLAWDLVTTSEEGSLGPIRHMLEESLASESGPAWRFDEISTGDCEAGDQLWKSIEGHLSVPSYLQTHSPGLDSRLAWGEDGLPTVVEEFEIPFLIRVPCSVATGAPGRPLQFGHGLFSTYEDAYSGTLSTLASEWGFVLFAVSWTGMAKADTTAVTLALLDDLADFALLPDRLHQSQLEATLMQQAMLTGIAADPEFLVDGVSVIDTSELLFYGYSQGGVLGGAQVAMSPYVTRGALGVPGAPFSLLLTRAANFQPFFQILQAKLEDDVDVSLFIALSQALWDPTESGGWANQLPDATLLLQDAVGDLSVSTVGAQTLARAAQARLLVPGPRDVYGLETVEGPTSGTTLMEMDFGYTEPGPETQLVAGEVGPHNEPFGSAEAKAQIGRFLSDGTVVQPCEGICDPD